MNTAILTAVIIAAASFVLQKTLNNIIYGIMIFITKPFKKGDKITIRSRGREMASGKVMGIGPLHIRIKEYTRDVTIVPNSMLEDCVVINSDYKNGMNRTNSLKFSYDSNLELAKNTIVKMVVNHPKTDNTEENTHIVFKPSEGGVILEYNVRTENIDTSFDVCSELAKDIIYEMGKHSDVSLV